MGITRVLANRPSTILADEPTGSLDTASVDRVLAVFRRIREERRVTILMATHDTHVAGISDRVVYMRDGRIVEGRAA
jgi:ABC-type lipoprotein export system ATPase subunit